MRVVSRKGVSLELFVSGYEFPESQEDYDSNWLVVQARIGHPRGSWSFRSACLLTYEARRLGEWLLAISTGSAVELRIEFLEPTLAFELSKREGDSVLRAILSLEALPPWAGEEDEVGLEFPLSDINMDVAVEEWRTQLARFPQRAPR